jgi:hypothetical protein
MMQYSSTQKPNTSDEDQINENASFYHYKDTITKISTNTKVKQISYENHTVNKAKQSKGIIAIIVGLILLLVVFIALFVWALVTRPKQDTATVQPIPQTGVNLTSYYISPTESVSIAYNNTQWTMVSSDSCVPLYNTTWVVSVSYINKVALAKYYATADCSNSTFLGYYVVNTAVNAQSNVVNVIRGNLNSMMICSSLSNC